MDPIFIQFSQFVKLVLIAAQYPKEEIDSYTEEFMKSVVIGTILDLGKDLPSDKLKEIEVISKDREAAKKIQKILHEHNITDIFYKNVIFQLKNAFNDFAARIMEVAYIDNKPLIAKIIEDFQQSFGK